MHFTLHFATMLRSGCYMGSASSAKENHHGRWNIVQYLCVFVGKQGTFMVKSCMQQSGAFNIEIIFMHKFYN